MAGNFQDDHREDAMRVLFKLRKDDSEGRSGIDAYLDVNGKSIPFELKTTSIGSVTTVRDFGPDHIIKWQGKHWLIGFFMGGRECYKYASPSWMESWIRGKEKYISPDFKLAELIRSKLTLDDMYNVVGVKSAYTLDDARSLHKKQYSKEKYLELQDLKSGYSPEGMLEILRDRTEYLMGRGSTLNNPHIPFNYFDGLLEITEDHAEQLRYLVGQYLQGA